MSLSSYLTARVATIETLSTALKMPRFIGLQGKEQPPPPFADLILLGIGTAEPHSYTTSKKNSLKIRNLLK